MWNGLRVAVLIVFLPPVFATTSSAQVRHIQNERSPIATAVWAGTTLYLSGQLPNPTTPGDAASGKAAVYGDTQQQSESALQKIEALLKEQGLGFSNVVMMHVYLVGDPKMGGRMDFAGMMASYTKHFGTKEQPNKPARTTVQVAALATPGALVEIEVIAVRPRTGRRLGRSRNVRPADSGLLALGRSRLRLTAFRPILLHPNGHSLAHRRRHDGAPTHLGRAAIAKRCGFASRSACGASEQLRKRATDCGLLEL